MKKNSSKFFEFKPKNICDGFSLSEYKGWNGLLVMKLLINKKLSINSKVLKSNYFDISNKEKVLIAAKGNTLVHYNNQKYKLNDFDAFYFNEFKTEYSFSFEESSELFLITAENIEPKKIKPIVFNFKNDLEPVDIWGGQCISRVFFGEKLNLVLFDLKPGFKFHDEGHANEQITWLIQGDMEFYVEKVKKKMTTNLGVDIGNSEIHGGLSNGAVGFDAFYPKREEKKYQKTKNT